LMTLYKLDDPI